MMSTITLFYVSAVTMPVAVYTVHCILMAAVEDDFREVYREVVSIQSNYYQFGIELGLPLREMDAIQNAFRQDIPQAFTEVLKVFLKHRYNIQKYGPPTWRKLVEAVDSPAGGNNHALAKKIAKDHHHPVNNGRGKDHPKHHPLETPVGETTKAMVESSANRPEGSCQLSGTVYAYSNNNTMNI